MSIYLRYEYIFFYVICIRNMLNQVQILKAIQHEQVNLKWIHELSEGSKVLCSREFQLQFEGTLSFMKP